MEKGLLQNQPSVPSRAALLPENCPARTLQPHCHTPASGRVDGPRPPAPGEGACWPRLPHKALGRRRRTCSREWGEAPSSPSPRQSQCSVGRGSTTRQPPLPPGLPVPADPNPRAVSAGPCSRGSLLALADAPQGSELPDCPAQPAGEPRPLPAGPHLPRVVWPSPDF